MVGVAAAAPARAANGDAPPTEEPADPGIVVELRAGAEIMPAQAINGMRDYSFDEAGAAYGATAQGLANVVGPLWVGLGISYDVVDEEDVGYSPYGPITGYLVHLPVLVEVGFRVSEEGSRVIVGLEGGRAWGGFENIQNSYTTEATASIAGPFLGLRAGYALSITKHFNAIGLLGLRAGSLDQSNSIAGENSGLLYYAIVAHLAVGFQP